MRILKPKRKSIDPNYINECEEALAPVLHRLVDHVEQRGWNAGVVAAALHSLGKTNLNHKSTNANSICYQGQLASLH